MKKLLMMTGAVAMMIAAVTTAKAEDAYVSTAGNHGNTGETHLIDTAWTITPQTRVELDYALLEDWDSSWGSSYLFGGSGQSPWFTAFVQNGYIGFHNGAGWKEIRTAGVNSRDVRFTAILDNANDTAILMCDGNVAGSVSTADSAAFGNATLKIASHVSGTNNFAAIKIYGLRLYEGGDKKRDYTPLVKGGVAGLRDSVTGAFLGGVDLTASANTPVEEDDPYLATDGESLYVDTHWRVTPQTRFELDYALMADYTSTDSVYLFGGSGQAPSWFAAFIRDNSNPVYRGIGFANGVNGTGTDANWVQGHLGKLGLVKDIRHTAVIDNANGWVGTLAAGVTNSYSEAISAASFQSGTIKIASHVNLQNFSAIKIYGYRIFEGGVKVHDYTPMRKGGQLGFKDSVTGAFFADEHTILLTAGGAIPEEQEDGYVATPANNSAIYINTEYYATENTRFELDYAVLSARSGTWYLFNGYTRLCAYLYGSGMGFGVGQNQTASAWSNRGLCGSSVTDAVGIRRTASLDNVNHLCSVQTAGLTNDVLSLSYTGSYVNYCPIYIGAAVSDLNKPDKVANFASIKIYGCRIFESDVQVRNFVPFVNDDGRGRVVGLRDTMTGLFVSYPTDKTHETSGSLSAGGTIDVSADPYIEGSGANGPYIITDYMPCGTTRAEIDFAQTVLDTTTTHYPFSLHGTSSNFKFGIYAFASTQTYGYNCTSGSANWTRSGMPQTTLTRTTLILDAKNRKYHRVENGITNASFDITAAYSAENRSQYDLPIFSTRQDNASDLYQAAARMPMKLYSFKLYENDVLVRDYVPAVSNGVAGLQDKLPGGKFLAPATGAFTYGGVFTPTVTPTAAKVVKGRNVTLTASAPGATSYRWLKNGNPVDGGTSGTLTVRGRSPMDAPIDTYQAIAIYTVDGLTAESKPSAVVTIENEPMGSIVSVR